MNSINEFIVFRFSGIRANVHNLASPAICKKTLAALA